MEDLVAFELDRKKMAAKADRNSTKKSGGLR
jgi:hypothetical protein